MVRERWRREGMDTACKTLRAAHTRAAHPPYHPPTISTSMPRNPGAPHTTPPHPYRDPYALRGRQNPQRLAPHDVGHPAEGDVFTEVVLALSEAVVEGGI